MRKNILIMPKRYFVFREDMKNLSNLIKRKIKKEKVKTFYLDFTKTNFFSRSFADEFLNTIDDFKKKKLTIKIVNLKPNLKKFLSKVKKKKEKIRKEIG